MNTYYVFTLVIFRFFTYPLYIFGRHGELLGSGILTFRKDNSALICQFFNDLNSDELTVFQLPEPVRNRFFFQLRKVRPGNGC